MREMCDYINLYGVYTGFLAGLIVGIGLILIVFAKKIFRKN